jgi:CRISPR-associated protein Cmr6
MAFDRPKKPGQKPQSPATQRSNPHNVSPPKKVITIGSSNSGARNKEGGGGDGNNNHPPSPWLCDDSPSPDPTASFVEYLRWMRSHNPDDPHRNSTKVQILQKAEQDANYGDRLNQLTERTKLIAGKGNYFQVKCPWRIRVGGHRGPESILLPAFDALGMPYIPSSTLRGAARTEAIRQFMAQEGMDWKQAEQKVAPFFGSLEVEGSDRTGKVIFLDAYPLPDQPSGGLAMDIANNIWNWKNEQPPQYDRPNPNPFLSLQEVTFLIGIRRTAVCDTHTFDHVQQWLISGLKAGIGSQINTGYGELIKAGEKNANEQFFQIEFSLKGQLIHGVQKFKNLKKPYYQDRQGKQKADTTAIAEVRPIAFKSMLRYWFRVLALGVLQPSEVKRWEANLFGAINPQTRGCIVVQITEGKIVQPEARANFDGKRDPCGEQAGILTLSYSSEIPESSRDGVRDLFITLTWLMFHLGGIGQGARRPCYSRQTRNRAPWWRGSTLIPDSEDVFWELPDTVQQFGQKFRQRLESFYRALGQLTKLNINSQSPITIGQVRPDTWHEAIDSNCRIVICAGAFNNDKPYALSVLHDPQFKQGQDYNGNLCGKVRQGVKPSPVWIADLENYQVVTVFGATQNPRQKYLQELRRTAEQYAQIFPLSNPK